MLTARLFWSFWFLFLCLLCPPVAYAYLDPGTGSVLLSALIGIVATFFFMIKSFFYKLKQVGQGKTGLSGVDTANGSIVFYSEGAQYWRTFKPVIEALLAKNQTVTYLTSDEKDPGLLLAHPCLKTKTLRPGNWTYATLNKLRADMCVLTTPGIDVLQIKRSKHVRHYAHIVHAVTDIAFYKLYSFDYYDSILCSGSHQIRSLRYLESLRGTAQKKLFKTGCPYIDELANELHTLSLPTNDVSTNSLPRLLIAPTWGKNGLLSRFGMNLIAPLADQGYPITIRPHPQTRVSEAPLLGAIEKAAVQYENITFDFTPSGLKAMVASDVLISDLSGIIFDYAFLLERPVITVAFTPDLLGQEANDLPWNAWELDILPKLGAHVAPKDICSLPSVLRNLPQKATFSVEIEKLRRESLYNFKTSGDVAAKQLMEIHASIKQGLEQQ